MDRSHSGNLKWSNARSMDDMQSVKLPSPAWQTTRPAQSLFTGPSLVTSSSAPMVTSASTTSPTLSLSSSSSSSSSSSTMSFAHTGQLSPISNGIENMSCGATDSSTSLASPSLSPPLTNMTHSEPSSLSSSACTTNTQWSLSNYVPSSAQHYQQNTVQQEQVSHEHHHHGHGHLDHGCEDDYIWDQDAEDILTIPKQEPQDDDDFCMDDLKEAPATPIGAVQALELGFDHHSKQKRPRGRPRKHPLMPSVGGPNKISKGRSKTGCLTCRKRKKKCDEAKPRCMNCEKNAVVCEGYPEKQIWKSGKEKAEEERLKSHNIPSITLSPLFHGLETVEDMIFWKHYNEHLSTVLTVEGEHKNAFKDMMVPIAVKHQGLMHSILSLASKHIDFETPYGMKILANNPATSLEALHKRSIYHHDQSREKFYADMTNTDDKLLISARYGQMLCFLLESLTEGSPNGDHRYHLAAYRNLIAISPPEEPQFLSFISEFFQYHIFADELLSLDNMSNPKQLPSIPPIHPPRLIGVADGLLAHLTPITSIRNMIRLNMAQNVDPLINYESLYQATEIDSFIRDWNPNFPPGDTRELVALLYKQMMWIYLFRTIYPPTPSCQSPSSCSTAPSISSVCSNASSSFSKPLITGTPPHSPSPSPPPIRAPPTALDPRVTRALEESLQILESFKPSDPSQTLLLLPCFVIGTACFVPEQQERIRAAVKCVKGYTGLRNGNLVLKVLEEVWRLMGEGEWERVWDWAGVARGMGIRVLPA
ncbi:fungal-specific transcription factor domain-containing protein [Podospora fimiseda]|uniref:Fungal-specific transcription factor domain-containing protein n=1 Tax=Podospora fimiseda TaxID=252190 RepID=A0AAN7BNN4_9PEZI|nr:fungal-specific transcription factor domain-containing protein [Podospora fimiseda]